MNEPERVLEVTGRSVRTPITWLGDPPRPREDPRPRKRLDLTNTRAPITWLKDPTRHLHKIPAVNAKNNSEEASQAPQDVKPPPDESPS